jgi:hypothetical protein
MPRWFVAFSVSSLLALPFVGVAWLAGGAVEPLSRAAVATLLRASALLQPATPIELEPESLDEPATISEPLVPAATKLKRSGAARASKPQAPQALFVAADTVLKLAQSGAKPRGAFVAETAQHPAGLRLSGVAALGIGVQDGDILIEALGVSPRSPGQIIGAILEARAGQARYLSGTLWRRGQTFRIVVEQPYLDRVGASPQAVQQPPQQRLPGRPTPS